MGVSLTEYLRRVSQVSPLMDRNNTNVPSAQVGFIKVLVAPLFNAWAEANIQLGESPRPHGHVYHHIIGVLL